MSSPPAATATIKAGRQAPKASSTPNPPPPPPGPLASGTMPLSAPVAAAISDAAFSEQVASAQAQRQARSSLGRGFSLKERSAAPPPPPQELASKLGQIIMEDSVTTHSHQHTPRGREQPRAGQRWWEDEPEGAPFPAEFQEPGKWPGKTRAARYSYFYDYIGPGSLPGTFTYKGEHLTAEAAAALRKGWAAR